MHFDSTIHLAESDGRHRPVRPLELARALDRAADLLLFEGRHASAEWLAWRAADLREVAQ